jgi:hypothetical protein
MEALCDLVCASVITFKCSIESGFLAVFVKLKVDRALEKDGVFEFVKVTGNLRVSACFHEIILEYVAEIRR